jgi:predicted nucleotidyltransferase
MSIDLEPYVLQQVRAILEKHVPECEVWAFGSRVGSCSKRFSDLDLAVISTAELPTRRLALLAYAFEDSDLPIRVDVIDWQSTSPAFRQRIAEHHEIIYRPASKHSATSDCVAAGEST